MYLTTPHDAGRRPRAARPCLRPSESLLVVPARSRRRSPPSLRAAEPHRRSGPPPRAGVLYSPKVRTPSWARRPRSERARGSLRTTPSMVKEWHCLAPRLSIGEEQRKITGVVAASKDWSMLHPLTGNKMRGFPLFFMPLFYF